MVGCAVLRLGLCVPAGLGGDVSNRGVVVGAGFSNQGSPVTLEIGSDEIVVRVHPGQGIRLCSVLFVVLPLLGQG